MPEANSTDSNNASATGTQSDGAGQQGSGNSHTNSNPAGNAVNNSAPGQGTSGTPPQQSHQAPPQQHGPSIGELVMAIQSMPEQIVRSLREATQPAQPPRQQSANQDTGNQGNGSQTAAQTSSGGSERKHAEPGRKSFGQWWFG